MKKKSGIEDHLERLGHKTVWNSFTEFISMFVNNIFRVFIISLLKNYAFLAFSRNWCLGSFLTLCPTMSLGWRRRLHWLPRPQNKPQNLAPSSIFLHGPAFLSNQNQWSTLDISWASYLQLLTLTLTLILVLVSVTDATTRNQFTKPWSLLQPLSTVHSLRDEAARKKMFLEVWIYLKLLWSNTQRPKYINNLDFWQLYVGNLWSNLRWQQLPCQDQTSIYCCIHSL